MADPRGQTRVQKAIGDIAPKLASLTDDLIFGEIWERPGLSRRNRSLVTVGALVTAYRPEQLSFHLHRAMENGVSEDELVEAITHLAFYAGWPSAMTAIETLKAVIAEDRPAAG